MTDREWAAIARSIQGVTRFEVIDHTEHGTGRDLVRCNVFVTLLLQDYGRTLKVWLEDAAKEGS